jgi:hypothetical protein
MLKGNHHLCPSYVYIAQGYISIMKGTGDDSPSTYEDLIVFGDDLSNMKAWGTREGKHTLNSLSQISCLIIDCYSKAMIPRTNNNSTPTSGPKTFLGRFFKKRDTQLLSPPPSSPLSSPMSNSFFLNTTPNRTVFYEIQCQS